MKKTTTTPGTGKVRRDVTGGKRGDGHQRHRRVRRTDPRRIKAGKSDPSLTGVAGLIAFGVFLRAINVDSELRQLFFRLKSGPLVVYPMEAQLRLLIDLFVMGEHRVFGLEAAAADPLFTLLAGGVVPSIDTVYRDLERFGDEDLVLLDDYIAKHAAAEAKAMRLRVAHLDVDSTVEPLFGEHEGALPGYNPRYPGRPSYHPIIGRIAEVDAIIGARLRPGDTTFGGDDAAYVQTLLERTRAAVGPRCLVYVRIDAAGDCTEMMRVITAQGAHFLTKAKMTKDLCAAVALASEWTTVDEDADGKPTRQVAEIAFARKEWSTQGLKVRVIAVRSRDRDNGKQIHLWNELDYTAQVFLTSDHDSDLDDLARRYNNRAGIEPLIAELKGAWGIDKVPSYNFQANHAALLLKVLAYNLLRRFVRAHAPTLRRWRAPWIRRALITVPGRIIRSGRELSIRMSPRPMMPMLN
jgi:hypothetical protein